jgi:hypothetical protein
LGKPVQNYLISLVRHGAVVENFTLVVIGHDDYLSSGLCLSAGVSRVAPPSSRLHHCHVQLVLYHREVNSIVGTIFYDVIFATPHRVSRTHTHCNDNDQEHKKSAAHVYMNAIHWATKRWQHSVMILQHSPELHLHDGAGMMLLRPSKSLFASVPCLRRRLARPSALRS